MAVGFAVGVPTFTGGSPTPTPTIGVEAFELGAALVEVLTSAVVLVAVGAAVATGSTIGDVETACAVGGGRAFGGAVSLGEAFAPCASAGFAPLFITT